MNSQSVAADPSDDYFANHDKAARWPFTIYHHPIERDMRATLASVRGDSAEPSVLVFGCGLFHEAALFERLSRLVLVDVDQRLELILRKRVAGVRELIVEFPQSAAELIERCPESSFDLVVAKEVIEHLKDPVPYLEAFRRLLRVGGKLWLSTPNYGDWQLALIERTFLEAVARLQGFSRRHIHPNKYSADRLRCELEERGFSSVSVRKTRFNLALCGVAEK